MKSVQKTCLAVLLGCTLLGGSASAVQDELRVVSVVTPERSAIDRSIQLVGTVLPWQRTTLRARVTGFVELLLVMPGDRVERGELLCALDLPGREAELAVRVAGVLEAEAAVASARAAITEAQADVLDVRARADVAESAVTVAGAAREVAAAELAMARVVLARQRGLFSAAAATQEDVDAAAGRFDAAAARALAASADVAMAEAQSRAAGAGIVGAEARLSSAGLSVSAAEAAVTTAVSRRAAARTQLDFGQLRCPFDAARVTARFVDPGALAQAGMTPLLELQDVSRMRFTVQVPEAQVREIVPGVRALITLAADDERHQARVLRVAGALEPATRTMAVEIDMDNAAGRFLPGMVFRARLSLETFADALLLPGGAIRTQRKASYVLVVEQGQLLRRDVELGVDDGVSVQIVAGLQGDEQVLRSNVAGLREGDKVRVLKEQSP